VLLKQAEPVTKLDPRVKRTRNLLLRAFKELLAEKDFATITVQDITERAEVNRATFYAHFADKFELMDYNIREHLKGVLGQKTSDLSQFTLANLQVLIEVVNDFVVQFIGHCHDGTHGELQMRIGAQAQKYLYELVLSWLIDEDDPSDNQKSNIAAGISWLIFGTVFQSAITRSKQSSDQLGEQIIAFLRPSLSAYLSKAHRASITEPQ